MSINNINKNLFLSVWQKYIPVIRILLKRSAAGDQVLTMNRIDFERDGKTRKSGYKFVVNFVNSKPDIIPAGNEFIQSFISSLQNDEIIHELFLKNNYIFTLSNKYQLEIKSNKLLQKTEGSVLAEEVLVSS